MKIQECLEDVVRQWELEYAKLRTYHTLDDLEYRRGHLDGMKHALEIVKIWERVCVIQ